MSAQKSCLLDYLPIEQWLYVLLTRVALDNYFCQFAAQIIGVQNTVCFVFIFLYMYRGEVPHSIYPEMKLRCGSVKSGILLVE